MTSTILVVDDEVDAPELISLLFIEEIEAKEYEFLFAANGCEALEQIGNHARIEMVISDINMPKMNGLILLQKIKELFPQLKTIVVSAYGDMNNIRTAMNCGAFDFLTKPMNKKDLSTTIEKTLLAVKKEQKILKKLEDIHEDNNRKEIERTEELKFFNTALQQKILDHEKAETKIEMLNKELVFRVKELEIVATTDSLTGCFNQVKLKQDLQMQKSGTLLYFKIANFAKINDALGFDAGDEVVLQIVNHLKGWLASTNHLYRCTRSEFAILCADKQKDGIDFGEALQMTLEGCHFSYKQTRIVLSLAISTTDIKFDDPLRCALLALGESKKDHKIAIFSDTLNFQEQYLRHLRESQTVFEAFEGNLFFPVFQGIRDNRSESVHYGKIHKYECLIRIQSGRQELAPKSFLKALMNSHEITKATKVMIMKSCEAMSQNDYDFSLNLTEQDLLDETLLDFIQNQFRGNKVDPTRVTFEILEGISSTDSKAIQELLENLKGLGCKIAIDDFGVEPSNIGRLLNFEPDYIKIDAKFIKYIASDQKSRIIVENVYDLANRIGAEVIAEYVESEEIQQVLENIGIHYSQGYLFSKPSKYLP